MYSILIIEDHPNLADGLERFLGLHLEGCYVNKAETGTAAWAVLDEKVFDLVLLDINLPDISGIDLCSRMISERKDMKIIALSGMVDNKSVRGVMEAGASGYILKTSITEDLIAGIETVMKGNIFLSSDLCLSL